MFLRRTIAYRLMGILGLLSALGFADPHDDAKIRRLLDDKAPLSIRIVREKNLEAAQNELAAILSGSPEKAPSLTTFFEKGATFGCLPVSEKDRKTHHSLNSLEDGPSEVFISLFREALTALKKKDAKYLKAYRDNIEKISQALLDRGTRSRSVVDLEDVALRYPLTPAAPEALLRAIDLRMGRGETRGVLVYAHHLADFYLETLPPSSLLRLEWVFHMFYQPVPESLTEEINKRPSVEISTEKRQENVRVGARLFDKIISNPSLRNRAAHYQPIWYLSPLNSDFDLAFSGNPQDRESYSRLVRFGMEAPALSGCSVADPLAEVAANGDKAYLWLKLIQPADASREIEAVELLLDRAKPDAILSILGWAKCSGNPDLFLESILKKMRKDRSSVPVLLQYLSGISPKILAENAYPILDASFHEGPQGELDGYDFLTIVRPFAYGLDPWYLQQLSATNPKRISQVLKHLFHHRFRSLALRKKVEALLEHGPSEVASRAGIYLADAYGIFTPLVQKALQAALQDPLLIQDALDAVASVCDKGIPVAHDWVFPFMSHADDSFRISAGRILACILNQKPDAVLEEKISTAARMEKVSRSGFYEIYTRVEPTPGRILDLKHILDGETPPIYPSLEAIKRWVARNPSADYSPLYPAMRLSLREELNYGLDIGRVLHRLKAFESGDGDILLAKAIEDSKAKFSILQTSKEALAFLLSALPKDPRVETLLKKSLDSNANADAQWAIDVLQKVEDPVLLKPYLKKISAQFSTGNINLDFHDVLASQIPEAVIKDIKAPGTPHLVFHTSMEKPNPRSLAFGSKLIDAYFKSNPLEKLHLATSISHLPWISEKNSKRMFLIAKDLEESESEKLRILRLAATPVSYAHFLIKPFDKFLPVSLPEPREMLEELEKVLAYETFTGEYIDLDTLASVLTSKIVAKEGVEKTEALLLSLPKKTKAQNAFRMLALRKLPTLSSAAKAELLAVANTDDVDFRTLDLLQTTSEFKTRKSESQVKPLLEAIISRNTKFQYVLSTDMKSNIVAALKEKPSLALTMVEQKPQNSEYIDGQIVEWIFLSRGPKWDKNGAPVANQSWGVKTLSTDKKRKLALTLAKVNYVQTDAIIRSRAIELANEIDPEATSESPDLNPANFFLGK